MNGFGGMVTVELAADLAGCRSVLERVRLFTLAESLGGTDSLIEHPAIMTHASVPAEQRRALGMGDNLVRLSIGIEDIDDLKTDLEQALSVISVAG
jgi:cystathionine gamma-lyase